MWQRLRSLLGTKTKVALAGGAVALITITGAQVVTPQRGAVAPQWPDATTTGVPTGTSLTAYSGPNPVTVAGTTITGKTLTGLTVAAANVTIRNSLINGSILVDRRDTPGASLLIEDSEIDGGNALEVSVTGLCCTDWVATRVEFRGGIRGAYCYSTCTLQDSWIHGQVHSTTLHESGIRIEEYANVLRNRLLCDAPEQNPDGGCSADLTGYPDFQPIHHNTIDGNLFEATTGGWCAYFGDTAGKAYSGQTHHITVTNNTFTDITGAGGQPCGIFNWYTDFPESDPNSVWSNNKTTLGEVLPATY